MRKYLIPALLASLSCLVGPLASMVDAIVLGQGPPLPLAQLTLALVWLDALGWIFGFLVHIPTREMSFLRAKNDHSSLQGFAQFSLVLALTLGLIAAVCVYFFASTAWSLQGHSPVLVQGASVYLVARLYGLPFQLGIQALNGIVRGLGHFSVSLWLTLTATLINATLAITASFFGNATPAFLGQATTLSLFVTFLGGIVWLHIKCFPLHRFSLSLFEQKKLIKNFGIDSMFLFGRSSLVVGAYFLVGVLASSLSINELAAYQVLLQLWMMSSYWVDGVAVVANTEVAAAIAGEQMGALVALVKKLLVLGIFVGGVFSLIYFLAIPTSWPTIFFSDPIVWSYVLDALFIVAVAQIPSSLAYVYDGIYFGLKNYSRLFQLMGMSFIFGLIPGIVVFYFTHSLFGLWVGLAGFNLWRFILCHWDFRKRYIGVVESKK